jgi:hypothetical protein
MLEDSLKSFLGDYDRYRKGILLADELAVILWPGSGYSSRKGVDYS